MHMPLQSRRKSRWRSGARMPARSYPPAGSSASWLCSIGGALIAAGRQELQRRVDVHRPGEVEPLAHLAAEIAERVPLLRELDPLGHDLEVERGAERHDGGRQTGRVGRRPLAQERAVHLEDVDGEAAQVAERRVAGAEVVEREPHAELLELPQPLTARSVSAISTVSVI